jgi:CheY-like chemotaxis protein
MKILLLDDDDAVRNSLGKALMHMGHTVFLVESIVSARRQIEQQLPDVALMDLHLKEGLSLPFIQELHAKNAKIPIIFSTADPGNAGFSDPFFKKAIYSIIEKPVSLKRLKTVLEWAESYRANAELKEKTQTQLVNQKEDELKKYLQHWGWKKVLAFLVSMLLLLALVNYGYYSTTAPSPEDTESEGFSWDTMKSWMKKLDKHVQEQRDAMPDKKNLWRQK